MWYYWPLHWTVSKDHITMALSLLPLRAVISPPWRCFLHTSPTLSPLRQHSLSFKSHLIPILREGHFVISWSYVRELDTVDTNVWVLYLCKFFSSRLLAFYLFPPYTLANTEDPVWVCVCSHMHAHVNTNLSTDNKH